MNRTANRALFLAILAAAALVAAGCEEVLEACAPCGSVPGGDATISGDPRLDGTLVAVQNVRRLAARAESDLLEDVVLLAEAFDHELPGRTPTAADVASLAVTVREALAGGDHIEPVVTVRPARCWVGASEAIDAEIACEERLDCYIRQECRQAGALKYACTGLCVGECSLGCQGSCYADLDPGEAACLGSCIGACAGIIKDHCPGRCLGICGAGCSARGASGECDGECAGLCTGACESDLPFYCGGNCLGHCDIELDEAGACAGVCRGTCPAAPVEGKCDGKCRGHLRPEGCDRLESCGAGPGCREMAHGLAWSALECEPPFVSVRLNLLGGEIFDTSTLTRQAGTLERALSRAAAHHARLSLLVDGVDAAGEVTPEDLEETLAPGQLSYLTDIQYLTEELLVVEDRKHLPLSGLKARLGWLRDEGTAGDFRVSAGAIPCIRPAFQDAYDILVELIPTRALGSGELVPDREAGMYRLLDALAELVALGDVGEPST